MTTFVGPHYEFDLKQIEVPAKLTENNEWIVTIPFLELIAIGDPGEEQAAVMAALGEALCELWCCFVCENDVGFRSDHDKRQALKFMALLDDVRERGLSDPASHAKSLPSKMTRRLLAALRKPDQRSIFDGEVDEDL